MSDTASADEETLNLEYQGVCEKVCDRIRDAGILLKFGWLGLSKNKEEGNYSFDPWGNGVVGHRILLNHRRADRLVDDYLRETITLAHEFGHYLSSTNGDRPDNYVEQVNRFNDQGAQRGDLSEAEARDIYEEEVRAWDYGLELLREIDFPDIEAAEEGRDHGLRMYRIRLGWEKEDG